MEDLRKCRFVDGKPAIAHHINRQPGANIVDTVDRIFAVHSAVMASMPASIKLGVLNDRTKTIRASVTNVQHTMGISVALVIMVVFVFLRSVRTTMIPSVAVPVSLVGTFSVLYVFGYSIDNLSLMALTIATGFVVDDAIVVIENITRHIEAGMTPMQAAVHGAGEIGFTVMSITISLIAVFIPILLMGGIVGRLFREFAITLSVAIALSLMISLTMTPMMCSRLLRNQEGIKHGFFYRLSGGSVEWLRAGYERTLTWVLKHQPLTLAVTLTTIALTVYLYITIPKGFFPQQDVGRLTGTILADQSSSFQAMRDRVAQVVKIVDDDPAVETLSAQVGSAAVAGAEASTKGK